MKNNLTTAPTIATLERLGVRGLYEPMPENKDRPVDELADAIWHLRQNCYCLKNHRVVIRTCRGQHLSAVGVADFIAGTW